MKVAIIIAAGLRHATSRVHTYKQTKKVIANSSCFFSWCYGFIYFSTKRNLKKSWHEIVIIYIILLLACTYGKRVKNYIIMQRGHLWRDFVVKNVGEWQCRQCFFEYLIEVRKIMLYDIATKRSWVYFDASVNFLWMQD